MKNYLIEGVSGAGKTTVATELQRRGFHVIHGDRELAYQGDPETGAQTEGIKHENHIWNVDKVLDLIADKDHAVTFFCGGSRNHSKFIDQLDGVFILDVDIETVLKRLEVRPDDEWGSKPEERELVKRLHATKEDLPPYGISIDSGAPLEQVVDEILRLSGY